MFYFSVLRADVTLDLGVTIGVDLFGYVLKRTENCAVDRKRGKTTVVSTNCCQY